MEQLRLKMRKTVNCFFSNVLMNVFLMIIVKKRKIQNKYIQLFIPKNRNMSIAHKEKSVTYFMISLEIERARILLYLNRSWTNSSLGLQWKYSKNIQKSQSEIKQNSFLNSYNYSLRQRSQGDCRVTYIPKWNGESSKKCKFCGDKCVFRARIPNAFCIQNTARNIPFARKEKLIILWWNTK